MKANPRHLVDSVTKKAAAFFKISRSVFSLAFSRRRRVNSARSTAARSFTDSACGI